MQILSNHISAVNIRESLKFARLLGNMGRATRQWCHFRSEVEITAVLCMCTASGHNYRNSLVVVDLTMGQIPRSMERIYSFLNMKLINTLSLYCVLQKVCRNVEPAYMLALCWLHISANCSCAVAVMWLSGTWGQRQMWGCDSYMHCNIVAALLQWCDLVVHEISVKCDCDSYVHVFCVGGVNSVRCHVTDSSQWNASYLTSLCSCQLCWLCHNRPSVYTKILLLLLFSIDQTSALWHLVINSSAFVCISWSNRIYCYTCTSSPMHYVELSSNEWLIFIALHASIKRQCVCMLDGTCPKGWLAQQNVICVGTSQSSQHTVYVTVILQLVAGKSLRVCGNPWFVSELLLVVDFPVADKARKDDN